MGRPDSRHITDRSINQRLYATPKTYAEQMGQGTRQSAYDQNDELYSQSQFKKPYDSPSYEEMEYFADPFPGYPWDWGFDTPFEAGINNFEGDNYDPWSVKFLCSKGNACYGMPNEECHTIQCGWPITGVEIVSQPGGCSLSIAGSDLCAECPKGSSGSITFNIVMQAKFQHYGATITVTGKHWYLTISACTSCKAPDVAWGAGSDTEIVRSGTASVELDNHNDCDYTWSVSGTGFTLTSETGISNTLNANASACGPATIAVTGGGQTITGYVRCTTGQWVLIDDFGSADCCSSWGGGVCHNSEIVDKFWYYCGFVGTCNEPTGCTCHNTNCGLPYCISQDTYEWQC